MNNIIKFSLVAYGVNAVTKSLFTISEAAKLNEQRVINLRQQYGRKNIEITKNISAQIEKEQRISAYKIEEINKNHQEKLNSLTERGGKKELDLIKRNNSLVEKEQARSKRKIEELNIISAFKTDKNKRDFNHSLSIIKPKQTNGVISNLSGRFFPKSFAQSPFIQKLDQKTSSLNEMGMGTAFRTSLVGVGIAALTAKKGFDLLTEGLEYGVGEFASAAVEIGGGFKPSSALVRASKLERESISLSTNIYDPKDKMAPNEIKNVIKNVSSGTEFSTDELTTAFKAYAAKTGKPREFATMAFELTKIASVSGSQLNELSDLAGSLKAMNPNLTTEQIDRTMRIFLAQGRQGTVELRDISGSLTKVLAFSNQFEGDAVQNMAKVSGIVQTVAPASGSPEEAATNTNALFRELNNLAREPDTAKKYGLERDKNTGKFNDMDIPIAKLVTDLIKDPNNLPKMDERAMRSLRAIAFKTNTGGEITNESKVNKNLSYQEIYTQVKDQILPEFQKSEVSGNDIDTEFSQHMNTVDYQLKMLFNDLNNSFGEQFLPTLKQLIPVIAQLAPHFIEAFKTIGEFINDIADNTVVVDDAMLLLRRGFTFLYEAVKWLAKSFALSSTSFLTTLELLLGAGAAISALIPGLQINAIALTGMAVSVGMLKNALEKNTDKLGQSFDELGRAAEQLAEDLKNPEAKAERDRKNKEEIQNNKILKAYKAENPNIDKPTAQQLKDFTIAHEMKLFGNSFVQSMPAQPATPGHAFVPANKYDLNVNDKTLKNEFLKANPHLDDGAGNIDDPNTPAGLQFKIYKDAIKAKLADLQQLGDQVGNAKGSNVVGGSTTPGLNVLSFGSEALTRSAMESLRLANMEVKGQLALNTAELSKLNTKLSNEGVHVPLLTSNSSVPPNSPNRGTTPSNAQGRP